MYYEPPDAESPILTKKANTRKQKPEKKHGEKEETMGLECYASQSKQRPSQSRPVPVCMRIRTYTPRNTKPGAKEAFNEACLRMLGFESFRIDVAKPSLRALACIIYMCKKTMEALLQYADLGSPAYM